MADLDSSFSKIIRFCSAVHGYETLTHPKERKLQGYKIWSKFIQTGAQERIPNIPDSYTEAIVHGHYDDFLLDIKIELLNYNNIRGKSGNLKFNLSKMISIKIA